MASELPYSAQAAASVQAPGWSTAMPAAKARWLQANVLPSALPDVDRIGAPREFRDLVALSSGNDFLLQVSNLMCAQVAFHSLDLSWIKQPVDASAIAALRASGATFTSHALQHLVAAPVGTGETLEVLLLFRARDVLFDAADRCRVRLGVQVAVGSTFHMPTEPRLARRPLPGEAVQTIRNPRWGEQQRGSRAIAAGELPQVSTPVMRTMSSSAVEGIRIPSGPEIDRPRLFQLDPYLDRHLELDDRTTFDVAAWLGNGTLEIPAVFAARSDQFSKTIKVTADVHDSQAHFTELSHDPALLLSPSDPTGLVQWTTYTLRRRGTIKLVDDVSLLGGPPTAKAGHLGPLAVDTFPTRTGPCSLNIAATVVAGRVAARSAVEFIGRFRYGVVWSVDAVRLLVRYCWEVNAFPRRIPDTEPVRVVFKGVDQVAEASADFQLEELKEVELEFDSNGRSDVLYIHGTMRVIPRLITLRDGTELYPTDPNDEMFRPSEPMPWSVLGGLTEDPVSAPTPSLLYFARGVTNGVTSRLGRPFCDPIVGVRVAHNRISAPAQRVALLVE